VRPCGDLCQAASIAAFKPGGPACDSAIGEANATAENKILKQYARMQSPFGMKSQNRRQIQPAQWNIAQTDSAKVRMSAEVPPVD
jgi:hypothetical protein